MKEFKYTITDPEGIHARPAGELVKAVKAFSSDIKIAKGGKAMNCKAIYDQAGERWKERRLQKDFRYHGTGGKERTGSNPDF